MSSQSEHSPWHWITELFQTHIQQPAERRIGIEIERIGIWDDNTPLLYRDSKTAKGQKRPGAETLLMELSKKHQWAAINNETGQPLGLTSTLGKVSLEPGSQVELSSDPFADLLTVKSKVEDFEKRVSDITTPWGLYWIGLGVNPKHSVSDIDLIPSPRYEIMTDYLGQKARLGTSMMRRTSSVQINLDYTSETEAIEMLRVALLATPVSYALFGNSPFVDGKDSGFQSFRGKIWQETDNDRTGLLPEVFKEGFGFADYAEYAWHRPLMFVQDSGTHYVPAHGKSLNDLAKGDLPNISVSEANQLNSVREIFTEARLKPGYVEIRSVDGLLPVDRYAASAFWVGLLYSAPARKEVLKLLGHSNIKARNELFNQTLKDGLKTDVGSIHMATVAQALVEVAESGLKSRGFGEEMLLDSAKENLRTGHNPASRLLESFKNSWKGDIDKVIEHCRQKA